MSKEKTNSNSVLENLPIGLIFFDKEGNTTDINAKALELFGFSDISMLSGFNLFASPLLCDNTKIAVKTLPYYDSFFNYHPGFSPSQQSEVPPGNRTIRIDVRYSKMFDNEGNLKGYLGAYIDRTPEAVNNEKIRDLDEIISMTAEVAQIGYARINILTDVGFATRQWYANNGMEYNDQYNGLEMFTNCIHPDDRHFITDFREAAKRGENPKLQALVRVNRRDGKWNYQKVFSVVTNFDPKHNLIEVSAITQNVTEQIELEHDLIEQKEKAESADKLKTAFLANMSHEIRTPLNSIIGFSRMMCQEDMPKEERRDMARIVEKNNEMLLQLISDILDLAKLEAGSMEFIFDDVDVNRLCMDVSSSIMLKANEGVKIRTACARPRCFIHTDPKRIEQVLANFASNAAKFTDKGHIEIGYKITDDNSIRFYVEDTGIGIPKDMQSTIFERFTKVNAFSQGAGIGLDICQAIMEHLGGKIGVDSKVGKGSTFWFELEIEC